MECGLSLEHFSEGPRWEGLTIAKKGQGGGTTNIVVEALGAWCLVVVTDWWAAHHDPSSNFGSSRKLIVLRVGCAYALRK